MTTDSILSGMQAQKTEKTPRLSRKDYDKWLVGRSYTVFRRAIKTPVTLEPSAIDIHVAEAAGRAMNSTDHNAGNALLNSETEGMDYCSPRNKGLAYKYNGFGKDFQGKKVRTKLNDAYRSGCIAGGKEMMVKVDPLTGEGVLKFDMYQKPSCGWSKSACTRSFQGTV